MACLLRWLKKTSFSGMVGSVTCLTGWVDSSRLSVVFIVVIMVVLVCVGVTNCGCTVVISGTVFVTAAYFFCFFTFLYFTGTLQWWHFSLGSSEFLVALWLTVFSCSSSGASKAFSSNSRSMCATIFQVWWEYGMNTNCTMIA